MTLEQALIIAVTALAACITVLWTITRSYEKECREDRKKLRADISKMWVVLDDLLDHACAVKDCPQRERIESAYKSPSGILKRAERRGFNVVDDGTDRE